MKRFWAKAAAVPCEGGFRIKLDEKILKMPSGLPLTVEFEALAAAIAAEWEETGKNFTPDDLPLTRLATTAVERVRLARSDIIQQLTGFGLNDLLCYRSANEPELAAKEQEIWQPWIEWANNRYGIQLKCTSGIVHIEQTPECREAFINGLQQMDEYQLAGLGVVVPALGSLVLGLAVQAGMLAPDAACDGAHLEERWQEARWGSDSEALSRRRAVVEDVAASARFMMLCRP